MQSKYIVIEGLEGSGKTTICRVVSEMFREFGVREIVSTREPGGTQLSEDLRNLILNAKSKSSEVISDKAEVLMFYAARIQLVEKVIKPALSKGYWVISDRHDLSTQAYQGGGRGIDRKMLLTLRDTVLGDFRPHLTLYLDVIPEIGLERIFSSRKKLNRIEKESKESLDFLNRIRMRYLELASQDDTIHTIDATASLEEVIYKIRIFINKWLHKEKI